MPLAHRTASLPPVFNYLSINPSFLLFAIIFLIPVFSTSPDDLVKILKNTPLPIWHPSLFSSHNKLALPLPSLSPLWPAPFPLKKSKWCVVAVLWWRQLKEGKLETDVTWWWVTLPSKCSQLVFCRLFVRLFVPGVQVQKAHGSGHFSERAFLWLKHVLICNFNSFWSFFPFSAFCRVDGGNSEKWEKGEKYFILCVSDWLLQSLKKSNGFTFFHFSVFYFRNKIFHRLLHEKE